MRPNENKVLRAGAPPVVGGEEWGVGDGARGGGGPVGGVKCGEESEDGGG